MECSDSDVDMGIGIAVYQPFWCSSSLVEGEYCDEAFVAGVEEGSRYEAKTFDGNRT